MKAPDLTEQDQSMIWNIVLTTAASCGGHGQLFARPLEFQTDAGRVRFQWPEWMRTIRDYLETQYGDKTAQALMFAVFTEVSSRERYEHRLQALTPVPEIELVSNGTPLLWN